MVALIPHDETAMGPQDESMVPLEAQIRECFGRVVYSHKAHEKCADICADRLGKIKLWQLILSVVVPSTIFVQITGKLATPAFGDLSWGSLISGVVALVLLLLNASTKNYDLGKTAERHKESADKLWEIRESYLSLLADIRAGAIDVSEARSRRDELQNDLANTYQAAPRTNYKGYVKAQDALRRREDLTFSDEEIDAFLPRNLRKSLQDK